MGYPGSHAAVDPDRPAIILGRTGQVITYGQLDTGSNRFAQFCRSLGMGAGGHIAVLGENHPRYLEVCWGADRSGLYYTAVNHHLTAGEAAYIVDDCEARVLVTTASMAGLAAEIAPACPRLERVLVLDGGDGVPAGMDDYDAALAGLPATPVDDEQCGLPMLYSSGTTGKPKGILKPLLGITPNDEHPFEIMFRNLYGMGPDTIYLSPAPLYHTAPLGSSLAVQRAGGTVVVMDRFDPEEALALIEAHRITHAQFVPTMFVRMLKLPEARRLAYDLSSLRVAIHAAAPCPRPIKEQMMAWWGPIIYEYYGGTEVNGLTFATPTDWLAHPGTVGRSILGTLKILDDELQEVPTGEVGGVYFAGGGTFSYHNDPDQTASAGDGRGATTIGDVGYVDSDGFLYLTDRKSYMIISGGVNIYPQEAEDTLIAHPKVADVAVFGVPDDEMGEQVKAVVQPADGVVGDESLKAELLAYCRARLTAYKCPRSIDFDAALPRTDAGKLYKRLLKDKYWAGRETRIAT